MHEAIGNSIRENFFLGQSTEEHCLTMNPLGLYRFRSDWTCIVLKSLYHGSRAFLAAWTLASTICCPDYSETLNGLELAMLKFLSLTIVADLSRKWDTVWNELQQCHCWHLRTVDSHEAGFKTKTLIAWRNCRITHLETSRLANPFSPCLPNDLRWEVGIRIVFMAHPLRIRCFSD